ncbi:MAG: sugar ABC transporter permease, partial [Chloroflexi bacterium]|nr:sugar ABC transporter permease [Chloroflexota bacterium]
MTAAAAPPPVAGTAPARSFRRIGEKWYAGYLFVLPHFLLFLFMVGLPFVYNLYIALTDYTFGGDAQFIGLKNFQNLADPSDFHFGIFWNGVWNTILFVLMSTPILVASGLGLAVLVNGKFPGRNIFRAIFFAPWTLGIGVVGLLW